MTDFIKSKYIPLDKSWIIRMGILDLLHGYRDIDIFLNNQDKLGGDLQALKDAIKKWHTDTSIDVGESGTLYRILQFISWKYNLNKKFIRRGTLKKRKIIKNPRITSLTQTELLKLDNETSQWASAAALSGDIKRIKNPPYKLKVTYDAIDHWKKQRKNKKRWNPEYDRTILKQAKAYLNILKKGKAKFSPTHAEDYCFACTFGYITPREGQKRWPSLKSHESNRIKKMSDMLKRVKQNKIVTSRDHRIVQALAMWGKVNNKKVKIQYPEAVNKSWPQFWEFLNWASKY